MKQFHMQLNDTTKGDIRQGVLEIFCGKVAGSARAQSSE
jgi:hypothetical protein